MNGCDGHTVAPDISEILGTTPLLHLIPKQELAPLVAYGDVSLQQPKLTEHLPDASKEFLDALFAKLSEGQEYEEYAPAFAGLVREIGAYKDPAKENIRFKRPAVAAASRNMPVAGPRLFYSDILDSIAPVPECDLVDTDNKCSEEPPLQLDVVDLAEIPEDADDEQVKKHAQHYQKAFRALLSTPGPQNVRRIERVPRTAATAPVPHLSDTRIASIYAIVDEFHDDDAQSADASSEAIADLARNTISVLRSDAATDLDVDVLLRVQALCLRHMLPYRHVAETPVQQLHSSLYACLTLLHTLSGQHDDRRLYVESHLDAAVSFLAAVVRDVVHGRHLSLLPRLCDCLAMLDVQVALNLGNDQFLGQIEGIVLALVFADGADLDDLRLTVTSLLVDIFRSAPSQRSFIFNELLAQLQQAARDNCVFPFVRLSNGTSVLSYAVLLVKLAEAYDASLLTKPVHVYLLQKHKEAADNALYQPRLLVINSVVAAGADCNAVFVQLADFVLQNIETPESNMKRLFAALFDDLVHMCLLPEWPGAAAVVYAVATRLAAALQESAVPRLAESYVLETLGQVGLAALGLATRHPRVSACDHTVTEEQLAEARNLHYQSLAATETAVGTWCVNLKYTFRMQRSLLFFCRLVNDIQTHQSFSVFYQIDANTSVGSVLQSVFRIVDEYLDIVGDGSRPAGLKTLALDENPRNLHEAMLLCETFTTLYHRFLSVLELSLLSPKAQLAAKAIRLLSLLIETNPAILLVAGINSSISSLLQDGSPLSRDAVIDLVSKYMFTSPELVTRYYPLVGSCSSDSSVLIRKRVVRLMRRLFLESSLPAVRLYASLKILKRLDDRELSVVQLAKKELHAIWLDDADPACLALLVCSAVADTHLARLFQGYLRELLSQPDCQRYTDIFKAVAGIFVNDVLLGIDSSESVHVVDRLRAVCVLAEVDGTLVSQTDLLTLTPYMGAADPAHTLYILKVMRLVLPTCCALRPDFVLSTHGFLLEQLTKMRAQDLEDAVAVLWTLSRDTSAAAKLLRAAISSLRLLLTLQQKPTDDAQQRLNLVRLISLVSCFGSVCDFESSRAAFIKHGMPVHLQESVAGMFGRILLETLEKQVSVAVRVATVSGLLAVARVHPALFALASFLLVLDHELGSGSRNMKLAIVCGLMAFLQRQDEEAKKKAGLGTLSTRDTTFDASEPTHAVYDEICSSIAQRYLAGVQELALACPDVEAPVHFLQLVLRLGLANPKLCAPTIIALEASTNRRVNKIATALHTAMFEKHESLADRSYVEAVRVAVPYVKKMTRGQMHQEPMFLRNVYRVVSGTYGARKTLVVSLCRLFEFDFRPNLSAALNTRDETIYLALNLVHVNFGSMEEVCLVLYSLNRAVMTTGLDLSDRVTRTISSDSEGILVENLQTLFVDCQAMLALIQLRHVLAAMYNIRPAVMETFRPNKADLDLRQQSRTFKKIDFPISALDLDVSLSAPAKFGPLFTRLVEAVAGYCA